MHRSSVYKPLYNHINVSSDIPNYLGHLCIFCKIKDICVHTKYIDGQKSCTFFRGPPVGGGSILELVDFVNGALQLPDFFRRDIFNGFRVILV